MIKSRAGTRADAGFTLAELVVVLAGFCIILGIAVPVLGTVMDRYRVRLGAQGVVTQLQYARMRAVSSNESLQVHFPAGRQSYQVESDTGAVIAGPFTLPEGIAWNTVDGGSGITFENRLVTFRPTGNIASGGGRAKIISRSGVRIDIVVDPGGIVRQTAPY